MFFLGHLTTYSQFFTQLGYNSWPVQVAWVPWPICSILIPNLVVTIKVDINMLIEAWERGSLNKVKRASIYMCVPIGNDQQKKHHSSTVSAPQKLILTL